MMMTCLISLASLLALLEAPRSAMATPLGSLPSSAAFASATNPASTPRQLQQHRRRTQHPIGGTTRHASPSARHALNSQFVTRSMHHHRLAQPPQARHAAAAHHTVTRMSSAPPLDEGRSSRHSSDGDTSGGVTDSGATISTGGGGGNFASVYGAVCAAVPALLANCASAAAAAEEAIMGDAGGGEMGARLDAPAAISFGAVVVAFAFLQRRIGIAIKARTARREYEAVVKDMENQRLVGGVDEEYVLKVGDRMAQLVREEQEARMVDIFGIPFNVVIPDGGGGADSPRAGGGATSAGRQLSGGNEGAGGAGAPSGEKLGIRETMRRKVEADNRDQQAREDEITPASTLKVAALWLVLISQLWLLVVLWNDPMGPATSAFLKD